MGKRIFAGVGIEPEAAMSDAAVAFDMSGFDHGGQNGQDAQSRRSRLRRHFLG
jgi:hypothetical protein